MALKHKPKFSSILMSLIKRSQRIGGEALVLVINTGVEAVVVDADVFVRVADGEIEREVVVEGVGGAI